MPYRKPKGQHLLNLVSTNMFKEFFLFLSMACWRSKDCHILKKLKNKEEILGRLLEELLNWPLIFSSNSGYYYSS